MTNDEIRKRLYSIIGETGPIWDIEPAIDKIMAEFWVMPLDDAQIAVSGLDGESLLPEGMANEAKRRGWWLETW